MNYPAAPISGIAASPGQATGYQAENYHRPKGRGIKPSPAAGGLKNASDQRIPVLIAEISGYQA
jgi:hypothetical protein